ncbi:MAG: superoxide dismutase family protein [Flavobacterium sp.]|nr:MAG: superoxide dismutase family protein [Flavobacterium sp.]
MKHYILYLIAVTCTVFTSCANKEREVANASLNATADNKAIGSAKFFQLADGKIKMDLEINMPEKADSTVAVHFHEHGDCGNMGENTHGHWNPTNESHGKWDSDAYHSGDIGNVALDSKGYAKISVSTARWSIASDDVKNIMGRGIIVHGGTDDYSTQPTGNSGPRIGCGVIAAVK